tara:strand:- start:342 stop:632 length:291 start_codon:yes stop_codon:yes gene_type:complete
VPEKKKYLFTSMCVDQVIAESIDEAIAIHNQHKSEGNHLLCVDSYKNNGATRLADEVWLGGLVFPEVMEPIKLIIDGWEKKKRESERVGTLEVPDA